ncbi:MAG: hypothetical protein IKQ31_04095 [Clostridia bacterium]|nr:hypothetical protein [Clostridia bacterium]
MENKSPKVVTPAYFMTILGYVFVAMLGLVIVYFILAWLFGGFNVAKIPIEGLKFTEEEIVISENGGTASITLISKAGEELEKVAQESEEPVNIGEYSVKSIKIEVQNELGNTISSSVCPISLPDMSKIAMGKPFSIKANINKTDNANIGGDCYLVATVESVDGRIYMTDRAQPLHVFVDVPIEKIVEVKAYGYENGDVNSKIYLNQEKVDIIKNDKKVGEYDKINSPLIVSDRVGLEVEVYPARALTPHTALKYTNSDSDSYIPPKAPFFTPSDATKLIVDENIGQVYVNDVYNDVSIDARIYKTLNSTNDYLSREIKFNITNTEFGGMDINVSPFVTIGDEGDQVATINIDLQLQEAPVLAFVLDAETISEMFPEETNNSEEETTMSVLMNDEISDEEDISVYQNYLNLFAKGKVYDLDAGLYATINNSYNVRHPASLQGLLSGFNIQIDEEKSGFKTEEKPEPDWIKNNEEYKYPLTIRQVGLNPNNQAPYIWFVYITREIQDGESVNIKFSIDVNNSQDAAVESYPVSFTTKKLNVIDFSYDKLLPPEIFEDKERFVSIPGGYPRLAMTVDKDGNTDNESILSQTSEVFNLESNFILSSDASVQNNSTITYTRFIYLVETGKKRINGEDSIVNWDAHLKFNKNMFGNRIVKTVNDAADNSKEFLLGDTYYSILTMNEDNSQFLLKALSAGDVYIYPFIVKTNYKGNPVDAYYNEITLDNVAGLIYGDGTKQTTDGDLTNKYVILSRGIVDGESKYEFPLLTVSVAENLSGFSFYSSTSFTDKLDSLAIKFGQNDIISIYAVPNSRAALSYADLNLTSFPGTANIDGSSENVTVLNGMAGDEITYHYFEIQLSNGVSSGNLAFTYNGTANGVSKNITTQLPLYVLGEEDTPSIVFKFGETGVSFGQTQQLTEAILGASSDQNYLYMYLNNGAEPKAFYKIDVNSTSTLYQSPDIQTHYYLLKNKEYESEEFSDEISLDNLVIFNNQVEATNQSKLNKIISLLSGANGSINSTDDCIKADDYIYSYDGYIYKLDDGIIAKLKDESYKLYCIATDFEAANFDSQKHTINNFAIANIAYEALSLTRELVLESEATYVEGGSYEFDDSVIFMAQIQTSDNLPYVRVLTDYGKSGTINEIKLANYNINHKNNEKFSISKNTNTGFPEKLLLKCNCYLGIKTNKGYLQVKENADSVLCEVSYELSFIWPDTN